MYGRSSREEGLVFHLVHAPHFVTYSVRAQKKSMEALHSCSLKEYLEEPITAIGASLRDYELVVSSRNLNRIHGSFSSLSAEDKEWIFRVQTKLNVLKLEDSISMAVSINQIALSRMIRSLSKILPVAGVDHARTGVFPTNEALVSRVRETLLHVARDWSSDASERSATYTPILASINSTGPPGKVLVSASGIGRLAYDIAQSTLRECVMIEDDPLRLIAMDAVLEAGVGSADPLIICPHVLETCNRLASSDNVVRLSVPDVAVDRTVLGRISVLGLGLWELPDPAELYSHIVTSFTLDSLGGSPGAIAGRMWSMLQVGGVWINCGPLALWDISHQKPLKPVAEFSEADLLKEISLAGFRLKEHRRIVTTFLGNPRSIMWTEYACVFFVAEKIDQQSDSCNE